MDKRVIITGASRGIGRATALQFLKKKWPVWNLSRERAADLNSIAIDLSAPWDPVQLKEKLLLNEKERVILIHNAAVFFEDSIQSIDRIRLEAAFQLMISSPLRLNELLLPSMGKGSAILYIGSILSTKLRPHAASYGILKHATIGMMRATCQDLIETPGIHTACICPGFTRTSMTRLTPTMDLIVKGKRLIEPGEMGSLIYTTALTPLLNGAILDAHLGLREF